MTDPTKWSFFEFVNLLDKVVYAQDNLCPILKSLDAYLDKNKPTCLEIDVRGIKRIDEIIVNDIVQRIKKYDPNLAVNVTTSPYTRCAADFRKYFGLNHLNNYLVE